MIVAEQTMQLEEVGAFDLAQQGAAAALVDAQERVGAVQGAAVDVEGVGQELAETEAAAGGVDGLGLAGLEEQGVRLAAGPRVGAEEGTQVALQGTG
ncbi:MAG: hypothetical protein JO242_03850 [Streptosporangiaceae bacterium]|nr:hypothetical protein [Streptosporangiaceae bacterium]